MLGDELDHLQVPLIDLAHDLSRRPHDHGSIRNHLAGRDQRAGRDHAMTADLDAIEDHGAVRDQRRLADGAAVQQRPMSDRYPGSQAHGLALVRVDDGAVLDVDAFAQVDPIAVPAQHAVEPDARARAEAARSRSRRRPERRSSPRPPSRSAARPMYKSCVASRFGADQPLCRAAPAPSNTRRRSRSSTRREFSPHDPSRTARTE